MEGDKSVTWR